MSNFRLMLGALSLAGLACTCGLLDAAGNLLPNQVEEGFGEIEAAATDFNMEEFEQSLEELEELGELEGSFVAEAELPADFPLPEGMEVSTAFEIEGRINAVILYSGTFDEAVAAWESVLTEAGYMLETAEEVTSPFGGLIIFEFSNGQYEGDITITGNDEGVGTQISLVR